MSWRPGCAPALTWPWRRSTRSTGITPRSEALADQARDEARAAGDRVLEAAAAARAADAAHCRLRGDDPEALAAVDAKIAAAGALVDALPDDQAARRLSMLVSLRDRTARSPAASRPPAPRPSAASRWLGGPDRACSRRRSSRCAGSPTWSSAGSMPPRTIAEEALESALLSGNVQVAYWASIGPQLDRARARPGPKRRSPTGRGRGSCWGRGRTRRPASASPTRGSRRAIRRRARRARGVRLGAPELWTLDRVRAAEIAVRVLLALGRVEEAAEWARRAPAEGGGRRSGVFGAIVAHADAAVLLAQGELAEAARVAPERCRGGRGGSAPLWAARCRTLAGRRSPPPAARARQAASCARRPRSWRPGAPGATAMPPCGHCAGSAIARVRGRPGAGPDDGSPGGVDRRASARSPRWSPTARPTPRSPRGCT